MKRCGTLEKQAKAGVTPVSVVRDDPAFLRWTKYLSDDDQEKAFAARDKHLSGLKSYFMPSVILPRGIPLSAVAKIFETINRTGMRLDTAADY